MSAKEMFKELGWKLQEQVLPHTITYIDEKDTYHLVDFYLDDKYWESFNNCDEFMEQTDEKVLKAIQKQIEELGWEV